MPRKPTIYIHNHPYHIVCRTNNKENFRIPLPLLWNILCKELKLLNKEFGLQIHSVVLMSNHYHLLVSTQDPAFISEIMFRLQNALSRKINFHSGRINHTFGGRYKPSLITTPEYFFHATKYIYQNPVKAGLCENIWDWPYSNFNDFSQKNPESALWQPSNGFDHHFAHWTESELREELNAPYTPDQSEVIRRATKKSVFAVCANPRMTKLNWA